MTLKEVLRYILIAGIFLTPFIPFIVTGSTFFPYITGKNFLFRILVELLFASWIILVLLDVQYRPRYSLILGSFTAFIGVIFLADLFSPYPFKSFWSNFERMEGFVTLAHLYVYFVIATCVMTSEKIWYAFLNTSVGASIIMGCMGLVELVKAFGQRVDVSFGNPTYYAIYALFQVFFVFLLMKRYGSNKLLAGIYVIAALLNLTMLYFTATRGAILGFIGGALLSAVLIAVFEKSNKLIRKSAIVGLAVLAVVVFGFFAIKDTQFVLESPVLSRFATIGNEMQSSGGTIVSRFMIWGMAWQGFQERPILGWGQDGFSYVFAKYYNPEMYRMEPWFDRTHNIVFDWLIAGGLLGAIAYFSIPVLILYYLWIYRRKEHPMDVTERALWTGLLAGYFFHNLFVFDNLTSYLLYMVVLGYIHVRVTQDKQNLFSSFSVSEGNVKVIIAPVVIVLVTAFIGFSNVRSMATAANLVNALRQQAAGPTRTLELYERAMNTDFIGRQEVAEQLAQMAVRIQGTDAEASLKQAFIARAKTAMEQEISRNPREARTQLFMGSFLSGVGQTEEGLAYLEKAHELSPKKQIIMFELGSRRLAMGNSEEALAILKQAFEGAPEYDEARNIYALAAIRTGDVDLAEELLVPKYGTLAVDDDRFLQAYSSVGRHDLVIQILEKRLEDNPSNAQAYVSLAAGYLDAGNDQRAVELIQQAIEIDPSFRTQGEQFISQIQSGATPTK